MANFKIPIPANCLPCCSPTPVCDCPSGMLPMNTFLITGFTIVYDGPTNTPIPLDSLSINGFYPLDSQQPLPIYLKSNFGSWTSSDAFGSYFGDFNMSFFCNPDNTFTVVIGVNSGDGSGSMGNGYTTGSAFAFQATTCNATDTLTDQPAVQTGHMTFSP